MKKLAMILGLGLMVFGCTTSSDGGGGGGDAGSGGSGGTGTPAGVGPAAPLALECRLLGNDATFPFEFFVDLAEEPVIGQPVDATVTVSLVFSPELSCGILAAGFTSVTITSASDTVTITGVSDPDPGEVTVTLPGTPIEDLQLSDACGCDNPGMGDLAPPCGTGPGLAFNFDPATISVTPDGASTMDFLLTVDGIDLNLAQLMGPATIPMLNIPMACETAFIGADLDGDEVYSTLATPPLQIQIPVLCDGVDCTDDNECTAHACVDGACSSSNVEDDTPCDGGDGACEEGTCVALLCRGVDCSDGKICTVDPTCNPENGQCEGGSNTPEGAPCNRNGSQGVCDGQGECVGCNADADCTVGETQCKESLCDNDTSECLPAANVGDGTNCMLAGGAAGQCNGGECVGLCFDAETRCPEPTAPAEAQCLDNDCDPTNGQCGNTPLPGQDCDTGDPTDPDGICTATGECGSAELCEGVTCPDDDEECTRPVCDPTTGNCGFENVGNGTPCDDGQGTCQDGTCQGIPLTCGDPLNGVAEPCLSASVLSDDCFLVTGSVPVPTTPIITPSDPLKAGVPVNIIPQIQASLPWPLLCTLAGPAGGGADLKDSVLEVVRQGATDDSVTRSYVNPTSVFDPDVQTPHGLVTLDFLDACNTATDIDVNMFVNNGAGNCVLDSGSSTGFRCNGGPFDGTECAFEVDCAATAMLDLDDLGGTLGATQIEQITPSGTVERFGFRHEDISIPLGDVIPGVLDDVCIGGACPTYSKNVLIIPSLGSLLVPASDGCAPKDRDGDGCPGRIDCGPCLMNTDGEMTCGGSTASARVFCPNGDSDCGPVPKPTDSPRVMYDANCGTADAVAGNCVPFIDGDDAFEVLACNLGTDTTNSNWGQSCTVATADADCGTGVTCTSQTLVSLFTESSFTVLTDCCNSTGDATGETGEPVGCGPPGANPPRSAACAGILAVYPNATEAQWVPVPVNP